MGLFHTLGKVLTTTCTLAEYAIVSILPSMLDLGEHVVENHEKNIEKQERQINKLKNSDNINHADFEKLEDAKADIRDCKEILLDLRYKCNDNDLMKIKNELREKLK